MTTLMNSLTRPRIKQEFPRSAYERGHAYFLEGRVEDLNVSYGPGKNEKIVAEVCGSKLYKVRVELRGPANKIHIRGTCTCPLSFNCKHVVAALLAAVHGTDRMDGDASLAPRTPEMERDARVDNWLETLKSALILTLPEANAANASGVDESHSLGYLLSTMTYHPLEVEVEVTLLRRLKTGALGSPKKFSRTAPAHRKHLYATDKDLLFKLEYLKAQNPNQWGYSDRYTFGNEEAEKLLPELLATGRCFWKTHQNSPLQMAPPRTIPLQWQMDRNGYQRLQFTVDEASLVYFFIENLWYVDSEVGVIGRLDCGVEKHIAKVLLAAPKIPPVQAQEVAEVLTQHASKSVAVKPKIFKKLELETPKPTPCLRLFQENLRIPGNAKSKWLNTSQRLPLATLHFDYNGTVVQLQEEGAVLDQVGEHQLVRLVRDKKIELAALRTLLKSGFCEIDELPDLSILNPKIENCFVFVAENFTPLEFTMHNIQPLRDQGWRVEIAPDYEYQVEEAPIEEWYSAIEEEEGAGYDWFGLELGITLKGEKINLLPILQKLLHDFQQEGVKLAELGGASLMVKLPSGRYLQLPKERVQGILQVLFELYDHESLNEDQKLRLSRLEAMRLMELEAALGAAQLRWLGGEKLRELGQKLTQFKGIQTVALPKQFCGTLRPYQLEGVAWLQFLREYQLSGILADDMGLGKTVQTLCHLLLEKTSGRMQGPSLVVAPTSLMFNWRMEALRFCPELKVVTLQGGERKAQFSAVAQADLVLTTYPLLVRDKTVLLKQNFYLLILDEAQFIKNAKSLSAQIAQQLKASHRLCLTGTPMENHLGELWSIFHFMMPGLLGDEKKFNQCFRHPIEKKADQERRLQLNRRIAPFLLRRTKDLVVKELPEKVELVRHVELEGPQRDLYETIRVTMQEKVREEIANLGLARSHIFILEALLKLRQVCCDPRLLKMQTAKSKAVKSAKLTWVLQLITELLAKDSRILLFSQFTEMLGLLEDELNKLKIHYVKLTGKTQDRQTPVEQFQNGNVRLFLISLKAGGTGLNLTAADTVIHYDPWWNPAVENQASDRAHRIGQVKTVFVYKIVVQGTVEEKILEMQRRKRALMEGLFSEKTSEKLKLTEADLQDLFAPLTEMVST